MADQQKQVPVRPGAGPEEVLALSEGDFYRLVDFDVRGKVSADIGATLRSPEVSDRWYLVLVKMKKNVESTLAATRADVRAKRLRTLSEIESLDPTSSDAAEIARLRRRMLDETARYEEMKAKRLRFRSAVEDVIQEARWLRIVNGRLETAERDALMSASLYRLRRLIENHQTEIAEDADEADVVLWRGAEEILTSSPAP